MPTNDVGEGDNMTNFNEITENLKVVIGNFYDSRMGNHSYAMYTTGYDFCVIDQKSGEKDFFQVRYGDRYLVTVIKPVELKNSREISFSSLNEKEKAEYFDCKLGNKYSAEDRNIFIYGPEEGQKINEEIAWRKDHMVYSDQITKELVEEIGHFNSFRYVRSYSRMVGTGYKDHEYVIDEKWEVVVHAGNGDYYTLSDYSKEVERKKAFGRRVAKLSKKAGVPWNIGVFAGYIKDDNEAVEILKKVKSFHSKATEKQSYELGCGIGRRTSAIVEIIGEETFDKLYCSGQNATQTLASYLANWQQD